MKNELEIRTVISYRMISGESGRATICGYDIHHTKYNAIKHSWDGVPMPNVKLWLFPSEIV
jgi:hypothetical protein